MKHNAHLLPQLCASSQMSSAKLSRNGAKQYCYGGAEVMRRCMADGHWLPIYRDAMDVFTECRGRAQGHSHLSVVLSLECGTLPAHVSHHIDPPVEAAAR